jgi:uncharacterized membrane protein YozB (DUF420 family)
MSGKEILAALNATLNASSAVLLVLAFVMIRRQRVRAHATLMISAIATSAVFLVFYLTSYYVYGDRSSGLQPGPLRTGYFLLLASHVLLAIVMLPMVIWTVVRAARRDWAGHRSIARPTWWVWMYVSVTGVAVYFMLYHLFPSLARA